MIVSSVNVAKLAANPPPVAVPLVEETAWFPEMVLFTIRKKSPSPSKPPPPAPVAVAPAAGSMTLLASVIPSRRSWRPRRCRLRCPVSESGTVTVLLLKEPPLSTSVPLAARPPPDGNEAAGIGDGVAGHDVVREPALPARSSPPPLAPVVALLAELPVTEESVSQNTAGEMASTPPPAAHVVVELLIVPTRATPSPIPRPTRR